MAIQKKTAHDARKVTNYMGADATVYDEIDVNITSKFVGYDKKENQSKISVLTKEIHEDDNVTGVLSDDLVAEESGSIIVDETVFYATMGGQEGDSGYIYSLEKDADGTAKSIFKVEDTIKLKGGRIAHVGTVEKGIFKKGEEVCLKYDEKARVATACNHSATHLLQAALRKVLGDQVNQAGSLVNPHRLRFDFTNLEPMTDAQIREVEDIVNAKIAEGIDVVTQELPIDEARKSGARALFGEKYGEIVRVVSMSEFSVEFCGGTHVNNTAQIRSFKILSEAGVAAGVRRIEALTADNVTAYYRNLENEFAEAAKAAKSEPANLAKKITELNDEIKALKSENESLKDKIANASAGDVMKNVREIKGVKVLAAEIDNLDMNQLRNLGDSLKEKLGEGLVFIASTKDGKVSIVAMATDAAVKAGVSAGNVIKAVAGLVGGKGGGRPNMAQAGGTNADGIKECLEAVYVEAEKQIK